MGKNFHSFTRQYVWVFFVLAIICLLAIFRWIRNWQSLAIKFTEEQIKKETSSVLRTSRIRRNRGMSRATFVKKVAKGAQHVYGKFQIYGEWFLWKLYISEIIESMQQCFNLVSTYLCLLPIEITIPMCFLLAIDCTHCGWYMLQPNTPSTRYKRLGLDIVIDFLCVALPLSITYFVYGIPMSVPELISVTLSPSMFMLAKLDDLYEETIRHRAATYVLQQQTHISFKQRRNRKSISNVYIKGITLYM